jgi:hypothetical protein
MKKIITEVLLVMILGVFLAGCTSSTKTPTGSAVVSDDYIRISL